tara:strand:+ start:137 stop:319 length:183 start_codon:yes stop_codon:yes gene_type:complete
MMTRKDYVTTAEILNYHLNSNTQDSCTEIIKDIAEDFAVYFEEDNPRFQSKRFMEAVLGK